MVLYKELEWGVYIYSVILVAGPRFQIFAKFKCLHSGNYRLEQ
jgi:hypothetical protein